MLVFVIVGFQFSYDFSKFLFYFYFLNSWHTIHSPKKRTKIAIGKKEEFFFFNAKANKEKGKKEGQLNTSSLGKKIWEEKKESKEKMKKKKEGKTLFIF
jgi:hypothetical protein